MFWPVITEQGQLPSTWFYDPSLLDKLAESKGQRRPPPRFRACIADLGSTQRFTKARPQNRHHTDWLRHLSGFLTSTNNSPGLEGPLLLKERRPDGCRISKSNKAQGKLLAVQVPGLSSAYQNN